ncbi:MAG TPA: hypothetical protein VGL27_09565 [Negativicutes bacterium]
MNKQMSLFEKEKKYVLLSIREEPYKDILSGIKKYEYRTRYLKEATTAFIYVSRNIKKVMAVIEFDRPIIGSDVEISQIAEHIKRGSYEDMMEYLKNGIGYAIPVKEITEIQPIPLEELKLKFSNFVVPQSYYLLDNKKELLNYFLSKSNYKLK